MKLRHAAGALAGVVAVAAGVVVAAMPASALGGEQGTLLIRSTGSVFTQYTGRVTRVVKPGKPGTYTVGVLNTGTTTAQYRLSVNAYFNSCPPGPCAAPAVGVTAGSTDYSALATSGFFTTPVAPGATASYTLTITPAADASPGTTWAYQVTLLDTANVALASQLTQTSVAATTGSGPSDLFVTTTGEGSSLKTGFYYPSYNGPSLAAGKSSVFKVKLQNESPTSSTIHFSLNDISGCGGSFPAVVKAGSTDVTAAAEAGSYTTLPLAPKKSQTLTVTVKYLNATCAYGLYTAAASTDGATANQTGAVLAVNPAA